MKIPPGDAFLNVVLEARRFQFSVFSLTLENEETLRPKIMPWYIEIRTTEQLCSCTVLYKKLSLANLKARL